MTSSESVTFTAVFIDSYDGIAHRSVWLIRKSIRGSTVSFMVNPAYEP